MAEGWVEVTIETAADAGELLGLLDDEAVGGAWQEEGRIHLYWASSEWRTSTLAALAAILEQLKAGRRDITVTALPAQDWNETWARAVVPIRIGRRLVVRPSWAAVALEPGEVELVLDPKQAFGTGHHATTQLCVEWLEATVRGGESVLDLGTGSGILAMAALRFGAAVAVGLDCDPVGVEHAREAAAINGFRSEADFHVSSVHAFEDFLDRPALIVANLDRATLLETVEPLSRAVSRGSLFCLSGILTEDEADIREAFSARGAAMRRRWERDGWLALEFAASDSCEADR